MTDEELTTVLEDANAGRLSPNRISREMLLGHIMWEATAWVRAVPSPNRLLWDQIEKESKSGEELYQRLLEAGYFKSNFPKGFYG